MRLNTLKASKEASIFVLPSGNAREIRKSRFALFGSRYELRSVWGSRFVPPAPSTPVSTRTVAACGALPLTRGVNGAPEDTIPTGANVKLFRIGDEDFGCQTALKLKRCGTSKFDVASSRPRLNGLSTLLGVLNVCDDCPL